MDTVSAINVTNVVVTGVYVGPEDSVPDNSTIIDNSLVPGDPSSLLGYGWDGTTLSPPPPPPPPPPPSPADQAAALIAAGLQIQSTSNSLLDGTYGCDPISQTAVLGEMVSLIALQVFTNGQTTLDWLDIFNNPHTFNPTEFQAFAFVIGSYLTTLKLQGPGSVPSQPLTIA